MTYQNPPNNITKLSGASVGPNRRFLTFRPKPAFQMHFAKCFEKTENFSNPNISAPIPYPFKENINDMTHFVGIATLDSSYGG